MGSGSGSGSGSGEEEIHDCGMLPLEPNQVIPVESVKDHQNSSTLQKLSSECDTILDTECFTECADGCVRPLALLNDTKSCLDLSPMMKQSVETRTPAQKAGGHHSILSPVSVSK